MPVMYTLVSSASDALHSQCYATCLIVVLGLKLVLCVVYLLCLLKSLEFVNNTLKVEPFQKVASSGMKAKLLIYSQPRSLLCNKTLIGAIGCNADAAAANWGNNWTP